jgi:tetratricopeptide (TPR) repeat protein
LRRFLAIVILLCSFQARAARYQDSVSAPDSTLIRAALTKANASVKNAQQQFLAGHPDKAFTHLNSADELYKEAGNSTGQAFVHQLFGDYYFSNYVWNKAQNDYELALKLANESDYELKGNVFSRLGMAYMQQKKNESAAKYFSNAIEVFDSADLNAKSAKNYVNLANVRRLQQRFSDAEFMIIRRALPLYRSAGYVPGRIGCFDALGHIYHDQKRYSEAKWYFLQANTLARTLKDTVAIAESLINTGRVKTSISDYKLALKDFREAERLAQKHKYLKQLRDVNDAFAELYSKTGNKDASFVSLRMYGQLKDSMHALEQEKIAVAKNVKPLIIAPKPVKKRAVILPKPQISYIWFYCAGLGLLSLVLFFYIRSRRALQQI